MSELPTIDPLKVAQRQVHKLRTRITEYEQTETQLEILAEALRDERDAANARVAELEAEKTQKDESV